MPLRNRLHPANSTRQVDGAFALNTGLPQHD